MTMAIGQHCIKYCDVYLRIFFWGNIGLPFVVKQKIVWIFVSCYSYGHRMVKDVLKDGARSPYRWISHNVQNELLFNDELRCVLADVRDAVRTYYSLHINNPLKVTVEKGSVFPASFMSTRAKSPVDPVESAPMLMTVHCHSYCTDYRRR